MPIALHRLTTLRTDIDTHLRGYFAGLQAGLDVEMSADGRLALEWLQEFTMRPAKRIRGALAVVGYEMFGGKKHEAALDLAVAMELLQSYLLIIDDVMDSSLERRGGPTVQVRYRDWLQGRFGSESRTHQGNMLAVNVGLVAQHLATRLLSGIDELPERVLAATRASQLNLTATGFGQMDDTLSQAGNPTSLEAIRQTYRLKSGYYTFVNPLQTGAALAGADADQLRPLREFGLHTGVAFQLQDDTIGMFGDEDQTGKSARDDLREGKLTMLMQHALEHADPEQLKVIRAGLGNPDVTAAQHREIKVLLEQLGSRQYAHEQALQEVAAAQAVVAAQQTWEPRAAEFLGELLGYVVNREK